MDTASHLRHNPKLDLDRHPPTQAHPTSTTIHWYHIVSTRQAQERVAFAAAVIEVVEDEGLLNRGGKRLKVVVDNKMNSVNVVG